MTDIEFVKGILITPDGEEHPFGIHSYADEDKDKDENYHDSAFKNDILSKSWFQKLEQELGFQYTDDTIHRQAMLLASKGIITLINASDTNSSGEEYNVYCIHTPQQLTQNQRKKLEDNYEGMKELLERKHAYFEANAYKEDESYLWQDFVYDLDEFYDRMNLNRVELKEKAGKGARI